MTGVTVVTGVAGVTVVSSDSSDNRDSSDKKKHVFTQLTQIVMKLKISNCDEMKKLKL